MEVILLIGAQAVGKSLWYHEHFKDTHVRINLDMLHTRRKEAILVEACLRAKQPFVVDNTNPTVADRKRYIEPAKTAHFKVVGYYFTQQFRVLLAANEQRNLILPAKKRIPEQVVLATLKKIARPLPREGFDELHYVNKSDLNTAVIYTWRRGDGWCDEKSHQ